MPGRKQFCNPRFRASLSAARAAVAIVCVPALLLIFAQQAQAQAFKVIYTFTAQAANLLTLDRAGNISGTTVGGVYKLTHRGLDLVLDPLYTFQGGTDGWICYDPVAIGPDGSLYGTTVGGGGLGDCFGTSCGTVFNLRPPATACKTALCPWSETVLYRFSGGDGGWPASGAGLVRDQAGNLYGTTVYGGPYGCYVQGYGCGVAYQLTPSSGGWRETIIHAFSKQGNDGYAPGSGMIMDNVGNLYGTTQGGGGIYDSGTVFQLTRSGSGWTETILHSFKYDTEGFPRGPLIMDQSGTLYGTAITSDIYGSSGATIFSLSPRDGGWDFSLLHAFHNPNVGTPSGVVMDAAGDLYGTISGGLQYGTWGAVFKLTASDGWAYTDIHDFTGGSDGGYPEGLRIDAEGNLYGTTGGGGNGYGVVFEITP